MQGFNALDQWGRFEDAFAARHRCDEQALLAHREHGLFARANIGKMRVKAEQPTVEKV